MKELFYEAEGEEDSLVQAIGGHILFQKERFYVLHKERCTVVLNFEGAKARFGICGPGDEAERIVSLLERQFSLKPISGGKL